MIIHVKRIDLQKNGFEILNFYRSWKYHNIFDVSAANSKNVNTSDTNMKMTKLHMRQYM